MHTLTHANLPEGECCTFARWTHWRPEQSKPHTHTFHELFWIEEGEGVEWINGQPRVLLPGMLVLTRAEDMHSFSSAREGSSVGFVNFSFPVAMWTTLRRRVPELHSRYFDCKDLLARTYMLSNAEMLRIQIACHDLQAGNRDAFTAGTFLSAVMALLVNRERSKSLPTIPDWLAEACKKVIKFPHFVGGASALARLAGRCPEHVARESKRYLGRTPTEVVNEARLHHAAMQLCTTNRAILEIAADCGFENLGYFYALFQARFKTTPRRYRVENAYPPTCFSAGPR